VAPYYEWLKPRYVPGLGLSKTVLEATSLGAFMLKSALIGLEHGTPMKRCDFCSSWYYATRKGARFCSASCRSMSLQQNGRPRGTAK
jgi:hypothetical protein